MRNISSYYYFLHLSTPQSNAKASLASDLYTVSEVAEALTLLIDTTAQAAANRDVFIIRRLSARRFGPCRV